MNDIQGQQILTEVRDLRKQVADLSEYIHDLVGAYDELQADQQRKRDIILERHGLTQSAAQLQWQADARARR